MARSRTLLRTRPRYGSRRPPVRVVATAVGAVLVLGNGLLVLAPVIGLVGVAAGAGPVLDIPYASMTVAVVVGFLLAVGCLALAFASHRPWMAWTFVVLAWALSLVASAWPVVATADSAVDRARDIGPWILELVRTVRG